MSEIYKDRTMDDENRQDLTGALISLRELSDSGILRDDLEDAVEFAIKTLARIEKESEVKEEE